MTRSYAILIFVLLGTSCDMDLTQGFGDLLSIRNEVVKIVDTKNVKVNINNGSELAIYIVNSSLNAEPSEARKIIADQIAQIAYDGYTERQKLEVIYVVFSFYERKFAIVEVTSTVEAFQYSPNEIGGLKVTSSTPGPHQPNRALERTRYRTPAFGLTLVPRRST